MNKKTIYAYLAGILDGEGSIIIAKVKPNSKRAIKMKYKNPYYHALIQVKMTNIKPLELFFKYFKGSIYKDVWKAKESYKPIHCFRTTHNNAFELINKLYPFLIVKKPQAKLMLSFLKNISKNKNTFKYKDGLPIKIIKSRENFYMAMKKLNN